MKTLLSILCAFLILNGCAKMDSISFSNQKIVFQQEYINYAWGYSHNGFFIDSTGAIYTYL
ncbi:MAG: hypothetical protein PHV20_11730 [Bacteroidales bacterium]|nr:hypothetical protein [Bacteroidales bacterium]